MSDDCKATIKATIRCECGASLLWDREGPLASFLEAAARFASGHPGADCDDTLAILGGKPGWRQSSTGRWHWYARPYATVSACGHVRATSTNGYRFWLPKGAGRCRHCAEGGRRRWH
jgi:hypothetical protein